MGTVVLGAVVEAISLRTISHEIITVSPTRATVPKNSAMFRGRRVRFPC